MHMVTIDLFKGSNKHQNEHYEFRLKLKGEQTCFSPRCVSAEHSIYLTALILLASFCPCSRLSGDKPCSDKALNVSLSSLKSILVPTRNRKKTFFVGYFFFPFSVTHLHISRRHVIGDARERVMLTN